MIENKGHSYPGVYLAFSTLDDDGLFLRGDALEDVRKNWVANLKKSKMSVRAVYLMPQVHGVDSQRVDGSPPYVVEDVDALVSRTPGVFVAVKSADCAPLLLFDEDQTTVAAVHAGWKGTIDGVVEATVKRLRDEMGVSPEALRVVIGPSIGSCCYEVSRAPDDRLVRFAKRYGEKVVRNEGKKRYLDLRYAHHRDLERFGVQKDAIMNIDDCTSCGTLHLPSHYKRAQDERMISIIGLRDGK